MKNIFESLPESWRAQINFADKPYQTNINQLLETQDSILPAAERIFYAFEQVPFDKVKVVIVGQDPYHGPGQAHGLCFSVQKGIKKPPSLVNIFKELQNDLGITPPSHGCLEAWARQGILMLNATLTVRDGQANSHYGKGWERFTDAVLVRLKERSDPIIFVLWGRSAREKCARISLLHKDKY